MKVTEINYVYSVADQHELPDTVYKYRAVNEFLYSSLLLNQIWFAQPDSFNDPFEPERIFSDSPFSKALDRSVREAGVLCLCKRNDNLPMWSYYGNALKGLAIGYDLTTLVGDLKPVFPSNDELSPRWRYVYNMAYRGDGQSQIQEMDLLDDDKKRAHEYQKMFATKAAEFTHEDECRVVIPPSPDSAIEYAWPGHGLYRHRPEAVKEIVFGERMAEQNRQVIMKIMAGRDIRFRNAVRDRSEFKIRLEPVRVDHIKDHGSAGGA